MPEASVGAAALIGWGVATLALPGQAQSGDLHLVEPIGTGVLVAVVDGLGHGAEAATAAQAAVAALERHATESPIALIERCHRALKGTRGVVMSVALFARPERSMTWLGVGNVEGLLLYGDSAARSGSPRTSLVTRGGIVGSELPRPTPSSSPSPPAIRSSSRPTGSGRASRRHCRPRRRRNNSPITSWRAMAKARMMRSCWSPGIWVAPARGDDSTSSHGALGPVRSAG